MVDDLRKWIKCLSGRIDWPVPQPWQRTRRMWFLLIGSNIYHKTNVNYTSPWSANVRKWQVKKRNRCLPNDLDRMALSSDYPQPQACFLIIPHGPWLQIYVCFYNTTKAWMMAVTDEIQFTTSLQGFTLLSTPLIHRKPTDRLTTLINLIQELPNRSPIPSSW